MTRSFPLLLLLACDATAPCVLEEGEDPSLQIGRGPAAYTEVSAGDAMTLVHGPQGGYHLDIALAARGLGTEDPLVTTLRGTIDGEELAYSRPFVTYRCDPSSGQELAWDLRLIYDAEPEDLHQQTTTVTAEVALPDGDVLTDTLDLLIVDPELE